MARVEVLLPQWGMGMSEGTVLTWHKAVGDGRRRRRAARRDRGGEGRGDPRGPGHRHAERDPRQRGRHGRGPHGRRGHRNGLTGVAMDELSLPFDVVVVGAGVNGLGIARDAALRGLRVVLLEQDDLCSGVSAWSGRLVHGGLRYLEHRDFALVRESLRERELLFRLAPHLVKPVRLLMPFYAHNRRPPWMIRLGMVLYDGLSFDKKTGRHEILDRAGITARFTGIGPEGLTGSAVFTDGQVEDAERLCVELAVAAAGDGAVIRTKARVDEPILENGRVAGVRFRDTATGEHHEVRAKVVYNVAGPWIDRVFPRRHRPATAQRRHEGQPPDRRPVPGRAARRRLLRVAGRRAARAGDPLDGPLPVGHHRHPVRRRPRRRALRRRRDGLHPRRGQHARARGEPHARRRALHLLRRAAAALRAGQEGERRAAHPRAARARRGPGGPHHGRRREADDLPPARRGRRRRRVQTAGPQGAEVRHAQSAVPGRASPTRRRCARTWSRRACRSAPRTGCSSSTAVGPPTSSRSRRAIPSCWPSSTRAPARSAPNWSSPCATTSPAPSPTCWRDACCSPSSPGHGLESVERAAEILGAELGWDEERRKEEIAEYQRGSRRCRDLADPARPRPCARSRQRYVMALDLGSTSARAVLVDPDGRIVAEARNPVEPLFPRPGWVELDPVALWARAARQREAGAGRGRGDRGRRRRDRVHLAPGDRVRVGPRHRRARAQRDHVDVAPDRRDRAAVARARGSTPRSAPAPGSTTTRTSPRRSSPGTWRTSTGSPRGPAAARSPSAPSTRGCCGTSPRAARTLTDHTQASRTALLNLAELGWDAALLAACGIPAEILPPGRRLRQPFRRGRPAAARRGRRAGHPGHRRSSPTSRLACSGRRASGSAPRRTRSARPGCSSPTSATSRS